MLINDSAALAAAIREHVVLFGQKATEACCKDALQAVAEEGPRAKALADRVRAEAEAAAEVTGADKRRGRK